jgi:hypothetical protein
VLGRYSTNPPAGSVQTAAEIVAFQDDTLYVLNIGTVDVVDINDPAAPVRTAKLALPSEPTSVAVNGGLVAVAVPAPVKTDPGQVLFFRGGVQVGEVTVGALPDTVTFTPDGRLLAVANEGEPNSYGQLDSVDPEGSVSVVTTAPFRAAGAGSGASSPQPVVTIGVTDFNLGGPRAGELPAGARIYGPGASVAQDLEPEYVTIASDGRTAWVSLEENNAIARLDLRGKTVSRIIDLGFADHSQPGHALDASDQDGGINIANGPVRGLYLPDGLAHYSVDGSRFVLSANEGDGPASPPTARSFAGPAPSPTSRCSPTPPTTRGSADSTSPRSLRPRAAAASSRACTRSGPARSPSGPPTVGWCGTAATTSSASRRRSTQATSTPATLVKWPPSEQPCERPSTSLAPRSPMSSTSEPGHLNNPHHRQTLLQIFQHPVSHNLEWHAVLSLLEAVGSVELRHDGEYAVHIGAETVFLGHRSDKDLDVEQVLAVRRLLSAAGYGPVVEALEAKGKDV